MKKIYILSAAVLSILAAASCAKEENGPETFRTVISATLSPTKTALGEKEGEAWPNYWKAGDKISVNGVASEALGSEADGKATATFSFDGLISTPYNAIYPASAVSGYSDGSATVTLPASQNYVAGSYDPAAFIMGGKSTNEAKVSLYPCVSVIHLSLTGTASISKVKLTGAADAALSGSFTTDFTSYAPLAASNKVEMVAETPVALPAEFFIAVPAGLSGTLNVEVFDTDGGSMSKNATLKSALAPGQVYSPAALAYTASYDITIAAEAITSSTAVICWDNSPEAAYTIGVYEDESCTSLLDSYAVDAGNACWSGQSPRFCISGLDAGITCYVKVTNTAQNVDSNILPVTTAPFDVVEVSSNPADVGDVILAEDFSELRWDCDMIGVGAGYFPTSLDSFANSEVESFQAAATSNEKQLCAQTNALASGSRLLHWALGANKHLYIHPGYIKLVGQSRVTHLVTPALDNIPDGMAATLEVEVTASRYYSESSNSFATDKAIVAVQTDTEIGELVTSGTNTLDLQSNIASFSLAKEVAWHTYKVTLNNVFKGNRLAFGADKSVSGNDARMNISDIKVTVKQIYEPGALTLSLNEVSSSTASFTWTHVGSDASFDISKPYLVAIYSDSACSNLVASYEIPAEHGCWDGKQPSFVFSGLAPSTNYWCKVTDMSDNSESPAVNCTTSAFTVVDATTVTNAAVGDVILAEDFSEIGWGAEELTSSAGFYPAAPKTLYVPSGAYTTDDGVFSKYNGQAGRVYGDTRVDSDKRLYHWGFFGNSSVYAYAAYLRVGSSSSGARTHIVTPALVGIPAGKKATIDVTVTSGQYADNTNDVAVFVESDEAMSLVLAPDQNENSNFSARGGKYNGASLSNGYPLNAKTRAWTTSTVRIPNVTNDTRLVIGSYENIDTKNRFFLSDVIVTLVELKDPGAIDIEVDIQDFDSFKAFLEACEPGKTVKGNVIADITLTSAQVEEIDALYPVAEFDGILNGNNHTIAGLTKPLFNKFNGTASNLTLNSTLDITEAMDNAGIFAQTATDATLTGCISTGSITSSAAEVSGDLALGGLVGSISGCTLTACQNLANVTNNTAASGTACIGGLVGVADGANDLSGTASAYNYNKGVVVEQSETEDVAVGGVCGYTFNAASNFNYCKSLAPDGDDVEDIEIKNSTKNKVYVGGIIGKSAVTSSMDYTYNSSDVKFTTLKITQTGQVFGGGIIGGWTASGEQTITGCENEGWVYTKASAGDLAVADSENLPKYWSCFAGISGMGAGTSENLGSSWYTITGKTFTNCTNSGTIRIYAALRSCIAGVVAYTENNPDGCVCTATDIRPYLAGGIKQVGENYHRNICGGVVGLCTASKVSNLKSTAKIVSQSSSPFAYTGGIIGYVPAGTIELENCKVSKHVQAAGSGDGRSALMCHVAQNEVTVTFTNCVVQSGTLSYATGSKVTISSSNLTAQHCVGPGSKYSIADGVLPTVADSL